MKLPEKTPARRPTELLATMGCSSAHQPGGGVAEGVAELVGVDEGVRDGVGLRLRLRVRDDV